MSKDPAFLFYPKDWLEGTAEMLPEEKGVYIDLLSHQHQKGSLPIENKRLAKLVGLSVVEFEPIWDKIMDKFTIINSRFINKKLNKLSEERKDSAIKKKISGIFAVLVRTSNHNQMVVDLVKENFSVLDFINIPNQELTIEITKWYNQMVNQMLNHLANANSISSNNGSKIEEVAKNLNQEVGSEKVKEVANQVWKDQLWKEQIAMGLNLKSDQLQRWMAMFNASICNDVVHDFSPSRYKKMIRGWISKQQSKGVVIENGVQKTSSAPPLTTL